MNDRQRMDMTKFSHQLVITGLAEMVEKDGLTPHQAFEVLEDIKRQTWHALSDIRRETAPRPDVATIKEHDTKLETVMKEIKGLEKAGEGDQIRGD